MTEVQGPAAPIPTLDDVKRVAEVVNANGQDKEIVCRIFVCPSENTDVVRGAAKFAIAAYMNVPVYAEFQRWLGRKARNII